MTEGPVIIDFEACAFGSIVTLKPLTPAARAWVEANRPPDALLWNHGLALDLSQAGPVVETILSDGLTIT